MAQQVEYNGLHVIYPTRNRAALATEVLRSVLEQADEAVSVLVSDNSTQAADREQLQAFIAELHDARVHYISPPESLAVASHWDWAIAQALARSDKNHFTLLTDRLLFKRNALRKILEWTRAAPDRLISYPRENLFDQSLPVRFLPYRATGRVVEVTAARLLSLTSRGRFHPALPFLFNCIAPRPLFDCIAARYGNYVASLTPDSAFCFRTLERIESLVYFDDAPLLMHRYGVSNSFGHILGYPSQATQEFAATTNFDALQNSVPAPRFPSMLNLVFHEYVLVQRNAANSKVPPLERDAYFDLLEFELSMMENRERRRAREKELHQYRQAAGLASTRRKSLRFLRRLAARAYALRWGRVRRYEFASAEEAVQFVRDFSAPYVARSPLLDLVTR